MRGILFKIVSGLLTGIEKCVKGIYTLTRNGMEGNPEDFAILFLISLIVIAILVIRIRRISILLAETQAALEIAHRGRINIENFDHPAPPPLPIWKRPETLLLFTAIAVMSIIWGTL